MYTLLTTLIILLSKIRDRFTVRVLRFDRPLPWNPDDGDKWLWVGCCDCGLEHFFVIGHSGTPVRPMTYKYKYRFGAKGWTKPNPMLGYRAQQQAKERGII